jgi:hypothetical protein
MRYKTKAAATILLAISCLGVIGTAGASASQPKFSMAPATFSGSAVGASEMSFGGVSCSLGSLSGEVATVTTFKGLKVTLKACQESLFHTPCTSPGSASGEIRMNLLGGKLVYLEAASSEVGVLLKPESGTSFASFSCTVSGSHNLTGELVCHLTTSELKCSTSGGAQSPTSYLNPVGCAVVPGVALKDNGTTAGYVKSTFALAFTPGMSLNSTFCV